MTSIAARRLQVALALAGFVLLVLFIAIAGKADRTSTATPAPPQEVQDEPANPVRAKKCKAALSTLESRVWKNWQRQGEYITVQVRYAYYLADLDDKRAFDGALRCAASEGRLKEQGIDLVSYEDARTGKVIATWGKWTGFDVK